RLSETILASALQYVQDTVESDWDNTFRKEGYRFKLLVELLNSKLLSSIPANAIASYNRYLKLMAEAGVIPATENIEKSNLIFDSTACSVKLIVKDIRDSFLKTTEINAEQFCFFEHPLRVSGDLMEKSDEVIRRILLKLVGNKSCLRNVMDNQSF